MVSSVEIFLLILLIFLSGVFSASETALVSLSRFKVRLFVSKKKKGSSQLEKLKNNPHRMLSTLLICNNLVNILASVIATNMALQIFKTHALAYATGILTLLILVFGEIAPKNIATVYNGGIGLFVAPIISGLSVVLFPIIFIFDLVTVKLFKLKPYPPKITEDEIRNIIDMAKEEGGIDKEETEMIHRVFKFDDIDVDAIMVPRIDMTTIEQNQTLREAVEIVDKTNFSRLPVFEKNKDKIVGIFYVKDAIEFLLKKNMDVPVKKLMRKPLFVPETKIIDETLKLFQKNRQHMGIIINEHGGVAGLITTEDIIEEIVGEITDETEDEEEEIKKIDASTFNILGRAEIREVNRVLKTKIDEEGDYDTISGLIMHKLGRIPKKGDVIELRNFSIEVKNVEDNRIIDVTVKKK